jgi:Right handed beta helix region
VRTHAILAILIVSLAAHLALAEDIPVRTEAELKKALDRAKAGDRLLLAAGDYHGPLSTRAGIAGTPDAPIVIAAADPKSPPVIKGGMQLRSPAYLELRDLVIDGGLNGVNIDDGGVLATPAHHIQLSNIVIKNVGPNGNSDGLKLSGVDDFKIENCRLDKWGSGGSAIDMVGCHQGVIVGCTFQDARSDQANGVQTKGGSSDITISKCRFTNSGGRGVNAGGSTGIDYFRPKDAAYEAKNITIEDCTFEGGMSAIAFVGVDGAIARHNTIYAPTKWAFRVLQENADPRFARCGNVKVENNLIAFRSDEVKTVVNVGGNTAIETFVFTDNAWCCLDRPQDTKRLVALPVKETGGVYRFVPKFKDEKRGDLSLLESAPKNAGARTP